MKWAGIAVAFLMLSTATAQAQVGAEQEVDQIGDADRTPSAGLVAALDYELPTYECEAPDLIRGASSPMKRRRFDRSWENFNDCRNEHMATLGQDFQSLQIAAEDTWLDEQGEKLNEHLQAIQDRATEISKDPYGETEEPSGQNLTSPNVSPGGAGMAPY